jgi:hypothetical protein
VVSPGVQRRVGDLPGNRTGQRHAGEVARFGLIDQRPNSPSITFTVTIGISRSPSLMNAF